MSMMSRNKDFDVSMFQKTTIGPKESLSVTVSFLPTSLGVKDDHIVIVTNFGILIYEVKGFGIKNLYNVPAFINSKVYIVTLYNFKTILIVFLGARRYNI